MCRIVNVFLFLILPTLSLAQTTPPAPSPTIRVTTRIVYVDVVVRDSHGQFVRGLTQPSFKLSEDGHPQQIDYFAEHKYDLASLPAAATPQKPRPNLDFSNVPPESMQSGSVNMILLDLVNTPTAEQNYARQQMLKFLKALPPGQQIALFILSDKLHMVQSFSGSSDLLVSAAKLLSAKPATLIRSDEEQIQDADLLAIWASAIGAVPHNITAAWGNEEYAADAENSDIRARITIQAFAALARATSGYPGRKNLLWLSELPAHVPICKSMICSRSGSQISDALARESCQQIELQIAG